MEKRKSLIEQAFDEKNLTFTSELIKAIDETLEDLDSGRISVVEFKEEKIEIHSWAKKAILLYFRSHPMEVSQVGIFQYRDKVPLKQNLEAQGVRVVPPGVARFGSFLEPGAILMGGYVNLGAHVGSSSMVDSWSGVGSCAYVGKDVHLAAGAILGGVLEPANARPVIVEDGCFIGAKTAVVEGVHVGREAVLASGLNITSSTPIIDVTSPVEKVYKGEIPARSVVIPGIREKVFPAGTYGIPCALIIGQRKESTDRKVSLTDALRDFSVPT